MTIEDERGSARLLIRALHYQRSGLVAEEAARRAIRENPTLYECFLRSEHGLQGDQARLIAERISALTPFERAVADLVSGRGMRFELALRKQCSLDPLGSREHFTRVAGGSPDPLAYLQT